MTKSLEEEYAERRALTREGWAGRSIAALRSHTTLGGMILLYGLGKWPSRPPFLTGPIHILSDGSLVLTELRNEDGSLVQNLPLPVTVTAMTEFFRRVADKLKLSDADREALFAALRQTIGRDDRPEEKRSKI